MGGVVFLQVLDAKLKLGINFNEFEISSQNLSWKVPFGFEVNELRFKKDSLSVQIKNFEINLDLFSYIGVENNLFNIDVDSLFINNIIDKDSASVEEQKKSETPIKYLEIFKSFNFPILLSANIDYLDYAENNESQVKIKNIKFNNPSKNTISIKISQFNNYDLSKFVFYRLNNNQLNINYSSIAGEQASLAVKIKSLEKDKVEITGEITGGKFDLGLMLVNNLKSEFLLKWNGQWLLDLVSKVKILNNGSSKSKIGIHLTPLTVNVDFKIRPEKAKLAIDIEGESQEKINFFVKGSKKPWMNLKSLQNDLDSIRLNVYFKSNHIYWLITESDLLPLNFEIKNSFLTKDGLEFNFITEDESWFKGNLNWRKKISLKFDGVFSETESWGREWTEGEFYYDTLIGEAELVDEHLSIVAQVKNVVFYDVQSDSVGIKLQIYEDSLVFSDIKITGNQKTIWDFTGSIYWKDREGLDFLFTHPLYGKINITMPNWNLLEVDGEIKKIERLPLSKLVSSFQGSLKFEEFIWNFEEQKGVVLQTGRFLKKDFLYNFKMNSKWDLTSLETGFKLYREHDYLDFRITMLNDSVVRLNYFNIWYHLFDWKYLQTVEIKSKQFEIKKWFTPFFPNQFIAYRINGNISYDKNTGIKGNIGIKRNLEPEKNRVFVLDELTIKEEKDITKILGHFSLGVLNFEKITLKSKIKENVLGYDADILFSLGSNMELSIKGLLTNQQNNRSFNGFFNGKGAIPYFLGGSLDSISISDSLKILIDSNLSFKINKTPFNFTYFKKELGRLKVKGFLGLDEKLVLDAIEIQNQQNQKIFGLGYYNWNQNSVELEFQGENFDVYEINQNHKIIFSDKFQGELMIEEDNLFIHLLGSKGVLNWSHNDILGESDVKDFNIHFFFPLFNNGDFRKDKQISGTIRFENINTFLVKNKSSSGVLDNLKFGEKKETNFDVFNGSLILDLKILIEGRNNHFKSDLLKTAFNGQFLVEGFYPKPILTGGVTGRESSLFIVNKELELNQLELNWDRQAFEKGNIFGIASKSVAVDCQVKQIETCDISWTIEGDFDQIEPTYSGNCGEDLKQEVNSISALSSITDGCFQEQSNSMALVWDVIETDLSNRLINYLSKKAFKPIQHCSFSGLDVLVGINSNADTTNHNLDGDISELDFFSLGCKTPDLFQAGFYLEAIGRMTPFFESISALDGEVSAIYSPKFLNRMINKTNGREDRKKIQFNSKVKSLSSFQGNDLNELNQEVEFEVGVEYYYDFWGL